MDDNRTATKITAADFQPHSSSAAPSPANLTTTRPVVESVTTHTPSRQFAPCPLAVLRRQRLVQRGCAPLDIPTLASYSPVNADCSRTPPSSQPASASGSASLRSNSAASLPFAPLRITTSDALQTTKHASR